MTTIAVNSPDASAGESDGCTSGARAGTAVLECSFINNRTVLTRAMATSPLRILNPRGASRAAWVFTSSFGGGLLSGDQLAITLDAGGQTLTYLSTQASTKIYRSTQGRPARQALRARLGAEATLVYTPDPLVPYADSRYQQQQVFDLAASSNLVLLDAFTSGRRASGEQWQLATLKSRNEITIGNRRILTDTLYLSQDHRLASPFRLAHFHYFATLILVGPRLVGHARQLLEYMRGHPIEPGAPLLLAASPLGDGIFLRLACTSTELATQTLHSCLAFLPGLLGEDPWLRKW